MRTQMFLLLAFLLGTPHRIMAQDDTWKVVAVIAVPRESASNNNELLFWIGLRNNSGTASLLCVRQSSFMFSTTPEARLTGGGHGGPHACLSEEAYGFVPSGETRYVFLRANVRQEGIEAADIEIQLSLAEGRLGAAVDPKATRLLTWKGSVQSALNEGARLR